MKEKIDLLMWADRDVTLRTDHTIIDTVTGEPYETRR